MTEKKNFESGESLVKNQYSKRLIEQEQIRIKCMAPFCQPGDKLKVENAPAKRLQEGNYFVQAAHISIQSAVPKMELVAIRP